MATNYQQQAHPIHQAPPAKSIPVVEKTSDTSPAVWVILALLLMIAGYFAYVTYYSPTQKMDMRADPTVAAAPAATTVTPTPDTATVTTPAPTSETISPATTSTDETTRQ